LLDGSVKKYQEYAYQEYAYQEYAYQEYACMGESKLY
jgi:hypothetical protein